MHNEGNLTGIKYRAWLRYVLPKDEGSSVKTFIDRELSSNERLLLPGGQDLPVVCFRVEKRSDGLKLIHTDKKGESISEYPIDELLMGLQIEYLLKIRSWFLFKHEITRSFVIPVRKEQEGQERNLFEEYLLPMQTEKEMKVKIVSQTARQITVTV